MTMKFYGQSRTLSQLKTEYCIAKNKIENLIQFFDSLTVAEFAILPKEIRLHYIKYKAFTDQ